MLDKNKKEIKEGDLVKLVGMVQYADGLKEKISKKTWEVQTKEGELVLPEISDGMSFLVVGSVAEGILPEFLPMMGVVKIGEGSVPQNYRILKDVESKNWKKGEIVKIVGKVSSETLEGGFLELVSDTVPNQHVLIVVDPVSLGLTTNNTQNG